jgi:hypothetical protein
LLIFARRDPGPHDQAREPPLSRKSCRAGRPAAGRIRSTSVRGFELRRDEIGKLPRPPHDRSRGHEQSVSSEKKFSDRLSTVSAECLNRKHCRGFKEINILPAHRSSNSIWPATPSGLRGVDFQYGESLDISAGLGPRAQVADTQTGVSWNQTPARFCFSDFRFRYSEIPLRSLGGLGTPL